PGSRACPSASSRPADARIGHPAQRALAARRLPSVRATSAEGSLVAAAQPVDPATGRGGRKAERADGDASRGSALRASLVDSAGLRATGAWRTPVIVAPGPAYTADHG